MLNDFPGLSQLPRHAARQALKERLPAFVSMVRYQVGLRPEAAALTVDMADDLWIGGQILSLDNLASWVTHLKAQEEISKAGVILAGIQRGGTPRWRDRNTPRSFPGRLIGRKGEFLEPSLGMGLAVLLQKPVLAHDGTYNHQLETIDGSGWTLIEREVVMSIDSETVQQLAYGGRQQRIEQWSQLNWQEVEAIARDLALTGTSLGPVPSQTVAKMQNQLEVGIPNLHLSARLADALAQRLKSQSSISASLEGNPKGAWLRKPWNPLQ